MPHLVLKTFKMKSLGAIGRVDEGKAFAKKHDIIFFYSKGRTYTFNGDSVRIPYHGTGGYVNNNNGNVVRGKRYRPHPSGKIPEDWWDLPALTPTSTERVGYPTQKPLPLLERIIKTSTNKGDIVLDPFCGCGTAIVACEKLERHWIGIDVTHIAIKTINDRLKKNFKTVSPYVVRGEPIDLKGAQELAKNDRFQFQIWALSLLGITGGMKKGADLFSKRRVWRAAEVYSTGKKWKNQGKRYKRTPWCFRKRVYWALSNSK